MADSQPYNRLFTSDAAFLKLYNGTVAAEDLGSATALFNMLALFRSFSLHCEVLEEDGSATWDTGYYPLPYRQKWTCDVELAQDLVVTNHNYDSIYHLLMTPNLGVGPYWLVFQKFWYSEELFAQPYAQRGNIRNLSEVLSGTGPQLQTLSFSMWGVPEPLPDPEA